MSVNICPKASSDYLFEFDVCKEFSIQRGLLSRLTAASLSFLRERSAAKTFFSRAARAQPMSQSLLANELGPGKTLVQQRSWLRRSVLVPATNEQRRLENGDVPRSVPPVPVQCFDVHQEAVQTNAATLCDELHV